MLGANLGSGILGMLSTLRSPPEARRVTLGNFLFKLIGCVLAIPTLNHVDGWIEGRASTSIRRARSCCSTSSSTSRLALLFMFWTEKIARVAERLLPARPLADDPQAAQPRPRRRSTRRRSPSPTRRARRCASAT